MRNSQTGSVWYAGQGRRESASCTRTTIKTVDRYEESASCQCVSGTHVPLRELASVLAIISFFSKVTAFSTLLFAMSFKNSPTHYLFDKYKPISLKALGVWIIDQLFKGWRLFSGRFEYSLNVNQSKSTDYQWNLTDSNS